MINLNNVLSQFRPDFGMHCKETNKTSLKVSAMYFGEQLLDAIVNKIPQRANEFTMDVDGMCGTFQISDEIREKICEALSQGKNMSWQLRTRGQVTARNGEKFRPVFVKDVRILDDGQGAGSNFLFMNPMKGISVKMKDLAKSFAGENLQPMTQEEYQKRLQEIEEKVA